MKNIYGEHAKNIAQAGKYHNEGKMSLNNVNL